MRLTNKPIKASTGVSSVNKAFDKYAGLSNYFNGFANIGDYEGLRLALENYNDDVVNTYLKENPELANKLQELERSENSQNRFHSFFNNTFHSTRKNKDGSNESIGLGRFAKPAIGTATLLYNLHQLKKTKDAAKYDLVSPRLSTATAPVRPIQQLSPEIINQFNAGLGTLGVKKTADSTANAINASLLTRQQAAALNAMAAQQAQNLQKERQRYDTAVTKNIENAIKTRNEQEKLDANVANKQRAMDSAIDSSYEKAKQETWNRAGSQVLEALHQRGLYEAAREKQKIQDEKSDIITRMQVEQNNAAAIGNSDPNKLNDIYDTIDKLRTDYKKIGAYTLPSYNQVMDMSLKFKKGGKLVPKNCGGGKAKCGGKTKKSSKHKTKSKKK